MDAFQATENDFSDIVPQVVEDEEESKYTQAISFHHKSHADSVTLSTSFKPHPHICTHTHINIQR